MCHIIEIDKDKKLAQVKAGGKVDALEIKEIFIETVAHKDWKAGFDMLCDYRNIDDFDVSTEDIDDFTEWLISIDELIGDGRCAVVASKDAVYGMSRMWEIISSDRPQEICIFRTREDAVAWLGS